MIITTSDQLDAANRHDSGGVVYVLSVTLYAASGVSPPVDPATINLYWSTREFTDNTTQGWEPYLVAPLDITREANVGLTEPAPERPVLLRVRNLPLRDDQPSVLASVVDGEYIWELSRATLRVFHLKPGQAEQDVPTTEWVTLVNNGFLGAPRDIDTDGFVLPLYSQGFRRLTYAPKLSERNADSDFHPDYRGRMLPIVIGRPDTWIPAFRAEQCFAFVVSGTQQGDTVLVLDDPYMITDPQTGAFYGPWTNGQLASTLLIHRSAPAYSVVGNAATLRSDGLLQVTLSSGLQTDIPKGAIVVAVNRGQQFQLAQNSLHTSAGGTYPTAADRPVDLAWLLPDGRIIREESRTFTFGNDWGGCSVTSGAAGPNVPFFLEVDPPDNTQVTQQPEFGSDATDTLNDKTNFPTGGSGTDNALVRDGNENTGASLTAGGSAIELTFNSAPSPFANSDTTESTLYLVADGSVRVFDGPGPNILGEISAATKGEYRFTQSTPYDFNQTLRILSPAATAGGFVYEAWWVHTLSRTQTLTRTQDAKVNKVTSGITAPVMRRSELIYRIRTTSGQRWFRRPGAQTGPINPYWELDPADSTQAMFYPTTVFSGLLGRLFSDFVNTNDGEAPPINTAAYDLAHAKYKEFNIQLHGVITRPVAWPDLERSLALQSRSYAWWGPNLHELVFQDVASGVDATTPLQEFRLPGVPNPNVAQGAGPLMERMSADQLYTHLVADFNYDVLSETYKTAGLRFPAVTNTDQLVPDRLRQPTELSLQMPMKSNVTYSNGTYVASTDVGIVLSGLYERNRAGAMRFEFDTGWIAFGVDRGSIVRVAFPVAPGVYRNVLCEVESIRVAPSNAERYTVSCRSIGTTQRGVRPYETWEDAFNDAMSWQELFTSIKDRWNHYFAGD